MKRIKLLDKEFALSIPASSIKKAVWTVAQKLNSDLKNADPLMLCILNGSFMFAADLLKLIEFPCRVSFVKLASYEGTESSGNVKELIGLNENIEGRTVVLLEDIIDSGNTVSICIDMLKRLKAHRIIIATLLFKPDALRNNIKIDCAGIEIPNDFIVGYGLDYNGYGRNLPDIYSVIQ